MINVAFPFSIGLTGRTKTADRNAYVRQLIELTLFTEPGERVGRPDFGCGLQQLVFSANGSHAASVTTALVQGALQHALQDDIVVRSVDATFNASTMSIEVVFVDRQTDLAGTVNLERRW
jgi:uncharacterized protein